MLAELQKYKFCGKFDYCLTDRLSAVCNASDNEAGIYLVYAVKNNKYELVYIGISGRIDKEGDFKVRKNGLYGRLVYRKRDKEPRKDFWLRQIMGGQLDNLSIFWYVTCTTEGVGDIPKLIEDQLVRKYQPVWNRR